MHLGAVVRVAVGGLETCVGCATGGTLGFWCGFGKGDEASDSALAACDP